MFIGPGDTAEPTRDFFDVFAFNPVGDFSEPFKKRLRKVSTYRPVRSITRKSLARELLVAVQEKGYQYRYLLPKAKAEEFGWAVVDKDWTFTGNWTAVYVVGSSHLVVLFTRPADAVFMKLKFFSGD